jgi:glycosyltransferase involved in cell wall biosynthesis
MIKVSVIITTFGKPDYLQKAIKSVFQQTLDSIELIVVDDNNPDTEARLLTESMVENLINSNEKIIYLKHEYNKNGSTARNTGVAKAKGKYISFLDSDDEYYTERLEKCFDKIEQCSNKIAGVYTGCEFRKNGKRYHVHNKVQSGNFIVDALACTFMLSTGSNIFIRKRVYDELNGFDVTFLRHQDYEFLVRMFKKYSLQAISEVLVIKNNENLNLPDVYKMIEVKSHFLNKFKAIIQSLENHNQSYIYHSHYICIAEHALKTKQLPLGNYYYLEAKAHGTLTIRSRFRRTIFTILNFIKE